MLKKNESYFFIDRINEEYVVYYGKLTDMIPKLDWRAGRPLDNPNLKCDCYCIFKCQADTNKFVDIKVSSSETLHYFDTLEETLQFVNNSDEPIYYGKSVIYFLQQHAK